jgi:hypothetical protein
MKRYTRQAISGIENKRLKAEIAAELESHMAERAEELTALGCPPAEADARAEAAMGETPETVGEQLNRIHKGRLTLRVILGILTGAAFEIARMIFTFLNNSVYDLFLAPVFQAAFMLLLWAGMRKRTRIWLFSAAPAAVGFIWLAPIFCAEALKLAQGELQTYVDGAFINTYAKTPLQMLLFGIPAAAIWCTVFALVTAQRGGRLTKKGLKSLRALKMATPGFAAAAACLIIPVAVCCARSEGFGQHIPETAAWYIVNADRALTDAEVLRIAETGANTPEEDGVKITSQNAAERNAPTPYTSAQARHENTGLRVSKIYLLSEFGYPRPDPDVDLCMADRQALSDATLTNESGDKVKGRLFSFCYGALFDHLYTVELFNDGTPAKITRQPTDGTQILLETHNGGIMAQIRLRAERPEPPPEDFCVTFTKKVAYRKMDYTFSSWEDHYTMTFDSAGETIEKSFSDGKNGVKSEATLSEEEKTLLWYQLSHMTPEAVDEEETGIVNYAVRYTANGTETQTRLTQRDAIPFDNFLCAFRPWTELLE